MTNLHPCGVRHVRMDEAPAAIKAAPGERAVLAVFWWRGLPLGTRLFSVGELPVPASAVPALAAAAAAPALLARGVDAADPSPEQMVASLDAAAAVGPLSVSVVVCTRDRPEALTRCLDSLSRCIPAPDEIVVVDNAPNRSDVGRIVARHPGVRLVAERRSGLSRARNRGIAAAEGTILAFTDDDVEVAPNWLGPIQAAFANDSVGCVTGLVLPRRLDSEAAATFELDFGGLAGSFVPATYDRALLDQPFGEAPPVWKLGAGANLSIRRAVIEAVGPFDARLGAGAVGCSEDSEFLHRALAAGWTCRYEPAAVVFHDHRDTAEALFHQLRAYMRGHVAALLVQFSHTRRPGNLVRAFVGLPYHFARTGLRLLFSPPSLRRRAYAWELLGLIEGPFALLGQPNPRHRRRHALASPDEPTRPSNATVTKRPLRPFLGDNPFPGRFTDGLFYRDKMRAIHRIAPERIGADLLEVGGGQSGLSKMLYPDAHVTNLDFDPAFADAPCNRRPGVRFVQGDATALPFPDGSFDVVTMFDLLEHVEDDSAVAAEAMRVLRPGGQVLVSTPDLERWHFPTFRVFRSISPSEEELFARWGHVRRGYTLDRLEAMFGSRPVAAGGFINTWLALSHDISFSRLPKAARLAAHALAAPVSLIGWALQRPGDPGTEIAAAWSKAA